MDLLDPIADILLILVPLITFCYVASCAIWPFKACRRCAGVGYIGGPFGGIRLCRRCDATGLRLRLGRRIWNALRRVYRDINNSYRNQKDR